MGWHLRFARTDRVEAMVSLKAGDQVRHQAHIFPDWTFDFEEGDDHVLAVMTRVKPLYATKESP